MTLYTISIFKNTSILSANLSAITNMQINLHFDKKVGTEIRKLCFAA